ncbi:DICT sensory domain-containing protein [Salinigranum sp. GCM10025319]|uniref:DICT sensory domain-containing protein n=1 Tax=Salinigranum sp. GCM10025319 TaxID=3252687 RepID=UPI00361D14C4
MTAEPSGPSFAELIAEVEQRRRTVTVYAPALPDALAALFDTRHVTLEHEYLPRGASEPFLTVTEDDDYVGSVDLPAVYDFRHPRIHEIGSPEVVEAAYRRLTSLLPDTVFSSLDRRQLLATSREIEDRAWRIGTGRLDAGFQTISKLRAQTDVYTALCERGLDVHLYGLVDRGSDDVDHGHDRFPPIADATFHTDGDELGDFWFMAYDGGETPWQTCGLVAEERSPGSFEGFWTYDPDVVARIFAAAGRFPVMDGDGSDEAAEADGAGGANDTESELP